MLTKLSCKTSSANLAGDSGQQLLELLRIGTG
jgi:hypothetical protein